MTFEEAQALWRDAPAPPPPADDARVAAVRAAAERLDRDVRRRDRREALAALAVLAVTPLMYLGADTALARAGAVVTAAALVFVVVWMRRARLRHPAPPPEAPPALTLRLELARVEGQIRLLRSVAWWYLSPIGLGLALQTADDAQPLYMLAFLVALYAAIYGLNQHAVRTELLPLRDALRDTLHTLTRTDD